MGGIKLFSSSSNDCRNSNIRYEDFKPSPKIENYTIIDHFTSNGNLAVIIKYNDVTNYEGVKILVYRDCDLKRLTAQRLIDPHFAEDKKMYSPIARFEPTNTGWMLAVNLLNEI